MEGVQGHPGQGGKRLKKIANYSNAITGTGCCSCLEMRLTGCHPCRRTESSVLLKKYHALKGPGAVFYRLSDPDRIRRLAGERISSFIVIETDAVIFFPSVHSPAALDFAVAMNRRFFYRGLWFPIISLNSEYIPQSSDRVLSFALEHEFEMSRIYQEISLNLRALSTDEKRDIMESAEKTSTQKLSITQDELIEDERLMHRLFSTEPLIPKPYAEMAMLLWRDKNYSICSPMGLKAEVSKRRPLERSF